MVQPIVQQPVQQPAQKVDPKIAKPVTSVAQTAQPAATAQPVEKKNSKWWLWLIVILVSLGAGYGISYLF
ncbi:hypothetical protein ISS08_01580 [Candidatus Pacearchaeota archaeon]|nr:hypothetical protein [Candidatus Pacearchaeota archaeon]